MDDIYCVYRLCLWGLNDYGYCLVDESGWVDNDKFFVYVSYPHLCDFVDCIKKMFGFDLFNNRSFSAYMQSGGICTDLCSLLDGYLSLEDFEGIFHKRKHKASPYGRLREYINKSSLLYW